MVSSITELNARPVALQVVVTRWVLATAEQLAAAITELAAHPTPLTGARTTMSLRTAANGSHSFAVTVPGKGRPRRTEALQVDITPWSPGAAEVVVRPARKRWKRSWSDRSQARYLYAAESVADAVADAVHATRGHSEVWPRLHALGDGTRIWVRPLRAEDRDSYVRALAGLSPATVAFRYGRPRAHLLNEEIDAFLDNGRDGREALAAVTADGRTIIGIARMAPLAADPGTAEVAIVVADAWQHLGVGHLLTRDLRDCAIAAGYRRFFATSQLDNHAVAGLLRRSGFRATSASLGVVEWAAEIAGSR